MAIGRITYPDKVDYRQEGQDDRYKITAENMNEIKKTFNDSAEAIERNVEETEQLQVKLDDAINRTGHYKIEDGKIYFEQIDGSFGEGIELPAQKFSVYQRDCARNYQFRFLFVCFRRKWRGNNMR